MVMTCTCRAWRFGGDPSARTAHTVLVAVRQPDRGGGTAAVRTLGVASAPGPEAAWRDVLAWIDGRGRLHAGLAGALDAAAGFAPPRPAPEVAREERRRSA